LDAQNSTDIISAIGDFILSFVIEMSHCQEKQMEVEFICSLSDITPARSLQKSGEEENPFDWNCSEKSQRTT